MWALSWGIQVNRSDLSCRIYQLAVMAWSIFFIGRLHWDSENNVRFKLLLNNKQQYPHAILVLATIEASYSNYVENITLVSKILHGFSKFTDNKRNVWRIKKNCLFMLYTFLGWVMENRLLRIPFQAEDFHLIHIGEHKNNLIYKEYVIKSWQHKADILWLVEKAKGCFLLQRKRC